MNRTKPYQLAQAILGIVVLVLVPLMFQWRLLLTWPVLFSLICGIGLLMTMPYTSFQEIWNENSDDHNSTKLMIFAAASLQLISIGQYVQLRGYDAPAINMWVLAGGLSAIMGFFLRLWTSHTLGRYFTAQIKIYDEHQIIEAGPYRRLYIRHPAYLGSCFIAFGVTLAFRSPLGLVWFALLFVPVYLYRIHIEEKALHKRLGEPYEKFCCGNWRLIPYVY